MTMYSYSLKTKDSLDIININDYIIDALGKSKVKNGIMLVYCPHTTGAITINEDGDPDVQRDLIYAFNILSPVREEYHHFEGNSHAHLLSSLIGASEQIIIEEGKLVLGTWQSLYFCEFDGPRNRKIHIKIIEDKS